MVKKIILIIVVIAIFTLWGVPFLKCEILTIQHGKEFAEVYKENTMMGEIDYLKVLEYSDDSARVYFVSKGRTGGDILDFKKTDEKWHFAGWYKTVWSKTGSADGFIWPYIR